MLDVPQQWAIVETQVMVGRSIEVANGRFSAHASIAEAANALGLVDLVFTSGAIQCVPDPLGALQALVDTKPRHFALARSPIWSAEQAIGIQESRLSHNGIGPLPPGIEDSEVRIPVTFTPFDLVSAALADYELLIRTSSPSASYNVDGLPAPGASMIYRRRPDV